ncbi:uncharacterized protein LOC144877854 isoform X2 [Branchiostoma floridae x Branchiostoma japonicum]
MSELSTTHHCSTAVQEANISHDSKAESDDTLQYPSASAQSKEGRELQIASPTKSKVQIADRGEKDGRVGVAPPLGEHEKYHVFFCYSSADAPWVKAMIQKLESDEYCFKCCIYERDFIPGDSIINNIARSIQESQKTVFVLSRDFVDSKWCEFERQLVMSENLTEKNRKIIPVMLRECVLPNFLGHMTHLEEWTPYFFDRFIGALNEDPDSKTDPFSTFSYNPNYINGQHVLKIEPENTWITPCCRFDDQILHAKLMSRGVKIGREDAVTVITRVMDTSKMKKFNWYYTKRAAFALFVLAMASLWAIAEFHYMYTDHYRYNDGGYIDSKAGLARVVVYSIFGLRLAQYFIGRYIMNKTMEHTMVEVNTILAKYHILATVRDKYLGISKAVLHFVYYERGSCLCQIQQDLMVRARETQDLSSVEVNIQGNFSEQVAEADALLMKYSELYVRLLVTKDLPVLFESRGHTKQRACLCQLVEMCEFGWKLGRGFRHARKHVWNLGVAPEVAESMADVFF